MPIKRKMGVLCPTPSSASPRSSGTRKTAANRKASPKSSIPDGPWPPVPRSPVGDIPSKVYEKAVIGLRVFVRASATWSPFEQQAEYTTEGHGDPPPRDSQPLPQPCRQDHDHQHDGHRDYAAVAEKHQTQRSQDAGGAVEEEACLGLGQPEVKEPVMYVPGVGSGD